jgi:uncharacterized membrane protein
MTGLSRAAILRGLLVGLLVIAWALLSHYGATGDAPLDVAAALATAPLVLLAIIPLWRVGNPLWMALGGLAILLLLAQVWPALRQNVALLYYLQNVGATLAIGALFGRTLFGNQDPLVTQFAKLADSGEISPAKARYTRQVTIAWTLFFAISALISSGLFWLAPAAAWSVFANLLSLPLLALMFIGEHLVRFRVLPPEDRAGFADTIRGYRASMAARRAAR